MSTIVKIDDWGGNVIPGEPQAGDLVRIDGRVEKRFRVIPPADAQPLDISKTRFMDICDTAWGDPLLFQTVMEAARDAVDADYPTPTYPAGLAILLRKAHARYEAAETFNKAVVAQLLGLFVTAGLLTQQQADDLLAAWPSA